MISKKTLVTGGAGFIGSHLVDTLLKEGHEVIVLDNFVTGHKNNLSHVKDRISFFNVDITNFEEILPLCDKVDWVFHLAGLADIVPSIENPLKYYNSNLNGTISLLEASRIKKIKKFIYAASSSCYGIPIEYPTNENSKISPMYPYALTKFQGEQAVLHWNKVYGLNTISLRLFNVYGPRSRTSGAYGAVFGVFLAQKLSNKPFTVVGDGNQLRDFIFVTDVVNAFIESAKSNVENDIFNVGTNNPNSINKLIQLLGSDNGVVNLPQRKGEPQQTNADISHIKSQLNWYPKVNFENGVEIMLNNIENWQGAPVWDKESIAEQTKTWFKYMN